MMRAYIGFFDIDSSGTELRNVRHVINNFSNIEDCPATGDAVGTVAWDFAATRKHCEGYFVQKVSVWCDFVPCDECCGVAPSSLKPGKPDLVYYEAWHVDEDKRYWSGHRDNVTGGLPWTDVFGLQIRQGKCGIHTVIGEVKFFCKDPQEDPNVPYTGNLGHNSDSNQTVEAGWNLNQDYRINRKCGFMSPGSLPSTLDPPEWWNSKNTDLKTVDKRTHYATVSYKCCDEISYSIPHFDKPYVPGTNDR